MNYNLPFVSVVIPAHNEETNIRLCLESITKQSYPKSNYEVILVDNKSTDNTVELVRGFAEVTLLTQPEGPVGRVRNTGALAARGDILMFLDGDCVAPYRWIESAVVALENQDNIALGGTYKLRNKPKFIEKFWLLPNKKNINSQKDLVGGAIALPKIMFIKAGGFDELLTSGEDTKFSKNLSLAGINIKIFPEMDVIHLGNPTKFLEYIKRQAWHSENYLQNFSDSIEDPTFYFVVTYTLMPFLSATLYTIDWKYSLLGLVIFFTIPAVFSIKRLWRAKNALLVKSLPMIYVVDTLYCIGRSWGLLRSSKRNIKKIIDQKLKHNFKI